MRIDIETKEFLKAINDFRIEQSFSRSVSSAQKEIMGDDGECQTLILHSAKADLTIEVIPTSRADFSRFWNC